MTEMDKIIAYVDGELNDTERQAMEAAATNDPDLRARIDAHRALSARLASAFAPVAEEPVPDALSALLAAAPPEAEKSTATVIPFRPRDLKRFLPQSGGQWASMAACLVVGVCLATAFSHGPGGDIVSKGGNLIAQDRLEKALTTQLAADEVQDGAPRVGLTFRDTSGAICRTFTTSAAEGIACREDNRWRVDLLSRPEASTTFVQAGSPLITQAVGARIDGEAFDGLAEKAAKSEGWKSVKAP